MPTGDEVRADLRRQHLAEGYSGIKFTPDPASEGEARAAQERFGEALRRLDFLPDARKAHFGELLAIPNVRHRGWYAQVQSWADTPGGSTVVVTVSPEIDHLTYGKHLFTGAHTVETYFWDGKTLNHVGTVPGVSRVPGLQMI